MQIFIDPDAPSGAEPLTGPFLHWIVANITRADASDGEEICETDERTNERTDRRDVCVLGAYRSPGPRPGSGKQSVHLFALSIGGESEGRENVFEPGGSTTIPAARVRRSTSIGVALRRAFRDRRLECLCLSFEEEEEEKS